MPMSQGNRQISTSVTRFLVRLPVLDKIKAVKDRATDLLRAIHAELGDLRASDGTLLANDAVLLEATTSVIQAVQELSHKVQALKDRLDDRLGLVAHEAEALKSFLEVRPVPNRHFGGGEELLDQPISCVAAGFPRGSGLVEPEAALMAYLYSFLPDRCAVDVGAHVGHVSEMLLDAGFEVHAFEPNPSTFHRLSERLRHHQAFRAYSWALGEVEETRTLHVASDLSGTGLYRDSTLYSSLVQHAMPADLVFTEGLEVTVRRLDALHSAGAIPARVGLVKIDTEGFDLPVVRGMGSHRYPVVVCEYWDSRIPFGGSKEVHSLEDLVSEMKLREYHWHIVFYRVWGHEVTRFYCNFPRSLEATWGNVFFFRDHEVFSRAREWCLAVFPQTFLTCYY